MTKETFDVKQRTNKRRGEKKNKRDQKRSDYETLQDELLRATL